MEKRRTPSERLLKKYFGIKSINELETALENLPQSRFDFLAAHIAEANPRFDLHIQIALTTQMLKTDSQPKKAPAIKCVMKKLLSKIDSDSAVLNDTKSIYHSLAPFTSGAYFVSDATRVLLKENREDRKALREMVEILFDRENIFNYIQSLNDLLFYNAKVGDEVCVVNDLTSNIEFDSIMDIFFADDSRKQKFIHLKKSKMILSENNKYILYRKESASKLRYVLKKHSLSKEKDWVRQIPVLLKGEKRTPNSPAPNNGLSPQ